MRTNFRARASLSVLSLLSASLSASVVINEINFHPAHPAGAEDVAREFVELHNPDALPVDISGWQLSGAVSFIFPAGTTLPAGGYLVVAADSAAFHSLYPSVTNYLGGWAGSLGNVSDPVELLDTVLNRIDKVSYDTEGDWAKRRQGGADPLHVGKTLGWIWLNEADGGGSTLERRSPLGPSSQGQNWLPSASPAGSPGASNSVLTADLPPVITKVAHTPAVPASSQLVTISAKVSDELAAGLSVSAFWRPASLTPGAFTAVTLHDDGLTGDEVPNDGVFSGLIPAQAAGTLVEYYVQATDSAAQIRSWPAPSDDLGNHDSNALYQVDNEAYAGSAPIYRLLVPPSELDAFDHEAFSSSNSSVHKYGATFIAVINGSSEIRHLSTIRIRGSGSRGRHPRSVRVDFPNPEPWQDNVSVNLNSQFSYLQCFGARLVQSAGITTADARPVAVRFNGVNRAAQSYVDPVTNTANATDNWTRHYGLYVHVEPINRDYLKHHFPNDFAGNLYTKRGSNTSYWNVAPGGSDLAAYYPGQSWEKQNNVSAADWADLHSFLSVMTASAASPGPSYLTDTGAVMDRSQWLRTIAISALLNNGETNLTNGRDDDYSIHRSADGRFRLLLHDLDTVFGMGDSDAITDTNHTLFDIIEAGPKGDIFAKLIPLFDQPGVVREYYAYIRALLEGPLSKTRFDALVNDTLTNAGWSASDINPVKTALITFMDARRLAVLGNDAAIPTPVQGKIYKNLSVTSGLTVSNGYETTTGSTATVTGTYDPTRATTVLINGQSAALDPKTGTFGPSTVTTTIVASNAVWKYKDDGSNQGTAWRATSFNDSAWSSGPAQLGYGGDGEATVISGGAFAHTTDYFRHAFSLANPSVQTSYTLRFQRDDAAVVYLNGTEVYRESTLPATGEVAFDAKATTSVVVEDEWISLTLTPAAFATGTNVIAAEVHQPATTSDCRWKCELIGNLVTGNSLALNPGLNRVTVEEKDAAGNHLRYSFVDIHRNTGSSVTKGGTLATSETWTAAGGPYLVSTALAIGNGVTLTIQPGATVYFANGVGITTTGTGRIVAEGTEFARIRLSRQPGSTTLGGLISQSSSSTECRFVWCDFEYFGGAAVIESTASPTLISHCTFTKTDVQYFSTHGSSFIVEDSYFETYTKPAGYPPANGTGSGYGRPEMLHGSSGLPASGYGIYRRNVFGHTYGFNDVIDFTGGQRPGPVMQFLDNVFTAATDDHLDLDNTDAFIAGNIFLHCHQDPARSNTSDTGSAISGGLETSTSPISEWTIIGNLFYDNDHAVLAKGADSTANTKADRFVFLHNTIYQITGQSSYGSVGVDIAAFNFYDNGSQLPPASAGSGALIENNIIWNAAALTANYDAAKLSVTLNSNLLPSAWSGPGSGNTIADPLLQYGLFADLALERIEFASDYALLMAKARAAFALSSGSPAKAAASDGLDLGALPSYGVILAGAPAGTTHLDTATISVGPNGIFNPPGSTQGDFPYGYPSYQWKLDGGPWSAETASAIPISLSGLANGTHTLQVLGKSDAGVWQTAPTVAVWTVDSAYLAPVVISEVMATNTTAFANGLTHPDAIELHNPGHTAADLSGWALSDDPALPAKFVFPAGTTIPAGGHLVLLADTPDANPGIHLGFSLDGDGESVVLSKPGIGWTTVDSVTFGLQLPNLSIARVGSDLHWDLAAPTLGSANSRLPTAPASAVLLNEWVSDGDISFRDDQVELYNTSPLPAAIGGCHLSDTPDVPLLQQLPPLSFVAGNGFAALLADGVSGPQANHLNFRLSAFYDWLVFSDATGKQIDRVPVTGAAADVSEGRLPDGSATITAMDFPSFGLSNVSGIPGTTTTLTTTLTDWGSTWKFDDTQPTSTALPPAGWNTLAAFNDSAWKNGPGPIGLESAFASTANPGTGTTPFFGTTLTGYTGSRITYLFRRSFTFSGNPANTTLKISRWIDDGYVVYLNGVEIDRKNITGTPPLALNVQAPSSVGDASAENNLTPSASSATISGALVNGVNLLAVEVRQNGTNSSDLTFALKIVATETTTTPSTPDPVRQRMVDLTNSLRVTEVMFAPANGADYEFLEVTNTSPSLTLDLADVRLDGAVNFTFPAPYLLSPGASTLVVKNIAAFRSVYGDSPSVAGTFTGRLDNAGEEILLALPAPWTSLIQRFTYSPLWFSGADGLGSSLEIVDTSVSRSAWTSRSAWRASTATGGSPSGLNSIASLSTWFTAYGVSGNETDSDGDGVSNLVEYAYGLSPLQADRNLAQTALNQAAGHLSASFSLPANPPADVTYVIETAATIGSNAIWTALATKTGAGPWTGTTSVTASTPANGRVSLNLTTPYTAPGRFLRIRVSTP